MLKKKKKKKCFNAFWFIICCFLCSLFSGSQVGFGNNYWFLQSKPDVLSPPFASCPILSVLRIEEEKERKRRCQRGASRELGYRSTSGEDDLKTTPLGEPFNSSTNYLPLSFLFPAALFFSSLCWVSIYIKVALENKTDTDKVTVYNLMSDILLRM